MSESGRVQSFSAALRAAHRDAEARVNPSLDDDFDREGWARRNAAVARRSALLVGAAPEIVAVLEEAEKQIGIGTIGLQSAIARLDAQVPQ